jgi:hypothetical protein
MICFVGFYSDLKAQNNNPTSDIFFYKKQEQTIGFKYFSNENREELLSPNFRQFEEIVQSDATFQIKRSFWNFLDYKQDVFAFNAEIGPTWGNGNIIDSSFYEYIVADHKTVGAKLKANFSYQNRYYWDRTNYTIVDVSAWGHYSLISQNAQGTLQDSNRVSSPYDVTENKKKLRYGFQAKAGWGLGRLNPMNNFMLAEYFLNSYFAGRNFSEEEIIKFADEIARIKSERTLTSTNDLVREAEQLNEFIKKEFLLTQLPDLQNELGWGEFYPRFNGARIEAGPYFNYFNREPDFVYGGYLKYQNEKYQNTKWNRNLCAAIQYNRYKKQDWITAEIDLGMSFYKNLRSRFDLGFKYVPGMVLNNFEDIEPVVHNFIPYFSYFTQVNSKIRLEADASLRINDNEQFMTAGPEFSLNVYWSKY